MILKNNKGIERNFIILFEIIKNNEKYIIYKDPITNKIYSGKNDKNKLKILSDEEFDYINNIIEKING